MKNPVRITVITLSLVLIALVPAYAQKTSATVNIADARACDKYLQEIAKDPDVRASAVSAQKLEIPACSALLVTDVVVYVVVDFSDEWTAHLLS
jgi:hypothetical protein